MNEDFGVGRPRPAKSAVGPRHRLQYNIRNRIAAAKTSAIDSQIASADDVHQALSAPISDDKALTDTPVQEIKVAEKPADDALSEGTDEISEATNSDDSTDGGNSDGNSDKPPKQAWYKRLAELAGKLSRKQWMLIAAVIILASAGAATYFLTRPDKFDKVSTVKSAKPKPTPPPEPPVSPLTGAEVSAEDAKRIVTGVMIENSPDARPQSGLDQAGVVFEAIAEYGITRFLALYQEAKPGNLGPVRSVRPYYVDWARSFDAPIAHVGGSPDALKKIKNEGAKDLDQFFNSGPYRRVGHRFAPHNMYTTMDGLNQLEAGKGWTGSEFTAFPRKKAKEVKPTATPAAKEIKIAISGPTYNIRYEYDPAANNYRRFMGGSAHSDAESRAQITPKVVIGLVTAYGLESDGYHSKYQITGSNKAYIFQAGTVNEVTWKRDASNSQYVFTGADSKPFKLDPGQTWITVVGDPTAVTYTP